MENLKEFAVIGVAAQMPEADNVEQFWENLKAGRDSVRPLPLSRIKLSPNYDPQKEYQLAGYLEGVDEFDPVFFKIAPNAAKYIDPAHRKILEAVNDAIEDAGYYREQFSQKQIGVFLGTFYPDYYKYITEAGLDTLTGSIPANFAGRVSYLNGFTGPALTIDTACSSTLVAIHLAIQSLRNEDCEMAIIGGSNIRVEPAEQVKDSVGIMSPTCKCRSFSADADGVAGGEGVIAILIKPLERALADNDHIYAVIKGTAINQDGSRSNGIAAPSPEAQKEVIELAWKKAGIDPLTISYIEAHGSATKLGDPIEVAGISNAFRDFTAEKQFCPISSVKTNIGHLDSVAGLAGFLKTILSLKNRAIPPTVHFTKPNPYIDFDNSPVYVNKDLQEWEARPGIPRRAGVSSFGLSGTNAHTILEEAPLVQVHLSERCHLFTMSAADGKALQRKVEQLAAHLEKHPELNLADVSYTLNCGRKHYAETRLVVVAQERTELLQNLHALTDSLPGLNDAEKNVGLLIDSLAVRVPRVERCTLSEEKPEINAMFILPDYTEGAERHLSDYLAADFLRSEVIEQCREFADLEANPRAAYFAFLYALADLWSSIGIKPQGTVGIGVGEAVSAVLTKRLTLEEGIKKAMAGGGNVEITLGKLKPFIVGQLTKGRNTFINFLLGSHLGTLTREALGITDGVRTTSETSEPKGIKFIDAYGAPAARTLVTALAQLYLAGVEINWALLLKGRRVSLPGYPYDRQSYWFDVNYSKLRQTLDNLEVNQEYQAPEIDLAVPPVSDIHTVEQVQEILTLIWQKRLGLQTVNLDSDFIEVGGDSLRGMLMMNDIKKYFAVELDIAFLLEYGTVRALSEVIHQRMQEMN